MENVEAAMRNMVKNIELRDIIERDRHIYRLILANKVEEVRDYLKPEDAELVASSLKYAKSPEMVKVIVNNMKHLNKTRKRAILKGYIFDPIRDRDPEMVQFFLETEPSLVNDMNYYNENLTTLETIVRHKPTAATHKIIKLLLRYGVNTKLKAIPGPPLPYVEEHIKFINEVLAANKISKKIGKLHTNFVSRREALTPPDGKAYLELVEKWRGKDPFLNRSGTPSPNRNNHSGPRSGTRSPNRSGTRSPNRSGTRSPNRSPNRSRTRSRTRSRNRK